MVEERSWDPQDTCLGDPDTSPVRPRRGPPSHPEWKSPLTRTTQVDPHHSQVSSRNLVCRHESLP